MGHKNEDVQLTIYQHQQICLAIILQEVSALALRYRKICLCFCIVHTHKHDQEQLFCSIVIVKSLVAGYIDFFSYGCGSGITLYFSKKKFFLPTDLTFDQNCFFDLSFCTSCGKVVISLFAFFQSFFENLTLFFHITITWAIYASTISYPFLKCSSCAIM